MYSKSRLLNNRDYLFTLSMVYIHQKEGSE